MADLTPALPGFEPGARKRSKHKRSAEGEWRERERKRIRTEWDRERDRKRQRPFRTCERCGKQYRPSNGKTGDGAQRYCSLECSPQRQRQSWPSSPVRYAHCPECGKLFIARGKRVYCTADCQLKANKKQILARYHSDPAQRDYVLARSHLRRADKLGLASDRVLLTYLIKRDKGRCQIPACTFKSRKVAPLGSKGPRKPSIDHVIPLSKGGAHELSNVQLAHYRCNLEKHNSGGGEQLMVVG